MDHHDLSISIRLAMNPRADVAPHGPGWYVDAARNEGYDRVVDRHKITPTDALRIAETLDEVLGSAVVHPAVTRANGAAAKIAAEQARVAAVTAARAEAAAAAVSQWDQPAVDAVGVEAEVGEGSGLDVTRMRADLERWGSATSGEWLRGVVEAVEVAAGEHFEDVGIDAAVQYRHEMVRRIAPHAPQDHQPQG